MNIAQIQHEVFLFLNDFSLEFGGHFTIQQKTSILKGFQSQNEKLENSFFSVTFHQETFASKLSIFFFFVHYHRFIHLNVPSSNGFFLFIVNSLEKNVDRYKGREHKHFFGKEV